MASNVQSSNNRNFPKGSYRAYTSLLKQYAGNGGASSPANSFKTAPASATPPPPPPKPEVVKFSPVVPLPPPPPPPPQHSSIMIASDQSAAIPKPELSIESLLALNSEEMELLDVNVLRAFLEVLRQENKKSSDAFEEEAVDANNNLQSKQAAPAAAEEDIETSKQNLIQSLKEQLLRFRRDA